MALTVFPLVAITAFYSGSHITGVPGVVGITNGLGQTFVVSTATHTSTTLNATFVTTSLTTVQTVNLPNLLPPINLPLGGIATGAELALIVSMVLVLTLVFRSMRQVQSAKGKTVGVPKDLEASRIEVASALDDAAFRIKSGLSYRESVLECYRAISGILEKRTGIDGKTLTAREFEIQVSKILQLNSPYLQDLTELFEVAKYSLKPITEEEASRALRALESLSDLLRGQSGQQLGEPEGSGQ
jgi:hypothetical protein